jgi:23S rRNA (pseudouridine1915-N3)-methyltransferase
MKLTLTHVSPRRSTAKSPEAEALAREFALRASRLEPTEIAGFVTEAALLEAAARAPGRRAATLVMFDSTGQALSSEEFAAAIRKLRDAGAARVFFCVGPADGWNPQTRAAAALTVSFGRMTLPHELARVLVAEQVYRALTILAGHPYHLGHS